MNRLSAALTTLLLAFLSAGTAVANDTVYYYSSDTVGSEVVITDANRNVIEKTNYAPYGQVLNRSLRDGPGYTGHAEDPESSLSYMQQRYYDPQSGRFLSNDPVATMDDGENFNRYFYVKDNPYRYTDPAGTKCMGTGGQSECIFDFLNDLPYDPDSVRKTDPKLEAKLTRLEKNMTAAYIAAQKLGGGTITVKGSEKDHIKDTKVSGDRIVHELREFSFNAETDPSQQPNAPRGYEVWGDADRTGGLINFFNPAINAPDSRQGDYDQQETTVHEAMHFDPYLDGWIEAGEYAHEIPFHQAIGELLGPAPSP